MSALKDYSINFKALKDGTHPFEYHIDNRFFALWEDSFYQNGDITIKLTLKKSPQMLKLDYLIKGKIESTCDNCLSPVDVFIDCDACQHVKFGDDFEEITEELVVIPRDENEFNVAKTIYDLIVTNLPLRHVHPENKDGKNGCDPAMVEKLASYMVGNDQAKSDKENLPLNDPRWDALNRLTEKNNK